MSLNSESYCFLLFFPSVQRMYLAATWTPYVTGKTQSCPGLWKSASDLWRKEVKILASGYEV